jgi:hypothetical protein
MSDELAYHARELRADLRIVTSAQTEGRAWIHVAALLEHDLEVHVAGALALLGHPPPARAPAAGFHEHVADALAALGDARVPEAARFAEAAAAIAAAHEVATRAAEDAVHG